MYVDQMPVAAIYQARLVYLGPPGLTLPAAEGAEERRVDVHEGWPTLWPAQMRLAVRPERPRPRRSATVRGSREHLGWEPSVLVGVKDGPYPSD